MRSAGTSRRSRSAASGSHLITAGGPPPPRLAHREPSHLGHPRKNSPNPGNKLLPRSAVLCSNALHVQRPHRRTRAHTPRSPSGRVRAPRLCRRRQHPPAPPPHPLRLRQEPRRDTAPERLPSGSPLVSLPHDHLPHHQSRPDHCHRHPRSAPPHRAPAQVQQQPRPSPRLPPLAR